MLKTAIGKFVNYAKEDIQKKFGKEITYAKDCLILSEEIAAATNRQVSVTTLKRFFGIVESPFNPSRFTLDTLSIYLNFNNWQDFINSFEKEKHTFSSEDSWEQLKKRTSLVTEYSLQSMNTKVGAQTCKFPLRHFAIQKTASFFKSHQPATAFIAPEGYGKSVMLTQIVDSYFTGKNALFPDDIICLIDGRILVKLLSVNGNLNRLYNLLEFDPKKSFSNYFRQHPEQVKGRFIIIIDGINEIYKQADKLNLFIDNLLKIVASYENISWFKLIISCHPDTWRIFTHLMEKNPFMKSLWYDVSFESKNRETINIPLLEPHEIATILHHNDCPKSLDKIQFHFPEILNIINHPYFLHLFLEVQKTSDIHSDIGLLYQYIHNNILADPLGVEKIKLIDTFFKACDNGKVNTYVNKDSILTRPEKELIYKELITSGILHEYHVPGSYLSVQTFVEFTHSILLEFFLANQWLKENSLSIELLRKIIEFYELNPSLQCKIIKYIIKIAFKEGHTTVLKEIYSIFQDPSKKNSFLYLNSPFHEILTVIALELRKNKQVRDQLVPWYAQSKAGQLLYFEYFFDMDCLVLHTGDNMDYYLKYNASEKAQIYGRFMQFMQHFLASDQVRCETEYNKIRNLELKENTSPLNIGFYYCVQIIFQSVYLKKMSPDLMKRILGNAAELLETGKQNAQTIPNFELAIIFALNYGNHFNEIIELSEYILNRYEFARFHTSAHYQLFRAIYARALLNSGHPKKAKTIFNQVVLQNIPVNTRRYINLRFQLIKVEFLITDKQPTEEIQNILNEIKSVAKMLRFIYFYQKAEIWEKVLRKTRS